MSDRMRTKRPLREPVRDAPGPKAKNYITPAGLQRLKDERERLGFRNRNDRDVARVASQGERLLGDRTPHLRDALRDRIRSAARLGSDFELH